MKLDIIIQETGATTMKPADIRARLAMSLNVAGQYWHTHFRKRHYHPIAFRIYRYTPRSKGYTARKWRKLKHANPLTFSGVSKRLSEFRKIKATHEKVDITMPTRAFNFKPKGSRVNMRDEATQINDDEHRQLETLIEQTFEHALKNFQGKRRSTARDAMGRFIKG